MTIARPLLKYGRLKIELKQRKNRLSHKFYSILAAFDFSLVKNGLLYIMGCLRDPANVQQFTCILNTFAGSLLDVCWIV